VSDEAVILRPFETKDREACLEIFRSNQPKFFLDCERPQFATFLDALPGPYFVLCNGSGRVLACGGYAMEPSTGVASLCWGMVHNEFHAQGLGDRLLLERLDRLKSDPGVRCIRLDTSQHTTTFFARLGFVLKKTTSNGYGPGLDRCDMELHLVEDRE